MIYLSKLILYQDLAAVTAASAPKSSEQKIIYKYSLSKGSYNTEKWRNLEASAGVSDTQIKDFLHYLETGVARTTSNKARLMYFSIALFVIFPLILASIALLIYAIIVFNGGHLRVSILLVCGLCCVHYAFNSIIYIHSRQDL